MGLLTGQEWWVLEAWGSQRSRASIPLLGLPVGGHPLAGPHLFPALSLLEEGLNRTPACDHMLSGSGLASPSLRPLYYTALEKCLSKTSWQVLLRGPGHLLWFPGCCKRGSQASYPTLPRVWQRHQPLSVSDTSTRTDHFGPNPNRPEGLPWMTLSIMPRALGHFQQLQGPEPSIE